jgi:hypothetical protein
MGLLEHRDPLSILSGQTGVDRQVEEYLAVFLDQAERAQLKGGVLLVGGQRRVDDQHVDTAIGCLDQLQVAPVSHLAFEGTAGIVVGQVGRDMGLVNAGAEVINEEQFRRAFMVEVAHQHAVDPAAAKSRAHLHQDLAIDNEGFIGIDITCDAEDLDVQLLPDLVRGHILYREAGIGVQSRVLCQEIFLDDAAGILLRPPAFCVQSWSAGSEHQQEGN